MLIMPVLAAPGTAMKLAKGNLTVTESGNEILVQLGGFPSGTQCTNQTCVLEYTVQNGTAKAGTDFNVIDSSGRLVWNFGESGIKSIRIQIIDDTESEGDEAFTINNSCNCDEIPQIESVITVTIADNDGSPAPGASPIDGVLQSIAPTEPAAEVGSVIETICPQQIAAVDLQRDCDALVGDALEGNSDSAGEALLQVTPDSAGAPVDASQNSIAAQTRNVGARLSALRRGATGFSLSGLSFDIDGNHISGEFLSGLLYEETEGGSASADALGFSRLGFFINGDISYGDKDAGSNEDGFEFDTQGITLGIDYRFTDNFILGGALGYSTTDTDIDAQGGELDTDAYVGTLFGTYYQSEQLYIDASINYGNSDYDQERRVRYTLSDGTTVDQTWRADYDGDQLAVTLGAGYQLNRDAFSFTPNGRLQYIEADVDGYREGNASNPSLDGSGWGLEIDDQTLTSFTLGLGGQINYAVSQSWGVLFPYASFEWVHEFEDQNEIVSGRFLGDPGATTFRLPTDTVDQNYFNLGVGVSALFSRGSAAFLNYQTVLGYDDLEHHSVNAGVRFEF
jgi:outer membrane autotransporter protein